MGSLHQTLASVTVFPGGEGRRVAVSIRYRLAESGLDRRVRYLGNTILHFEGHVRPHRGQVVHVGGQRRGGGNGGGRALSTRASGSRSRGCPDGQCSHRRCRG